MQLTKFRQISSHDALEMMGQYDFYYFVLNNLNYKTVLIGCVTMDDYLLNPNQTVSRKKLYVSVWIYIQVII